MASIGRALAPFAIFLAFASAIPAQDYNAMGTDQLKADLPNAHPSAYYILASKLYDDGEADEAVFWLYAGQLRYRTHLSCQETGTTDADAALFGALSEVIGAEINRYAFGNLEQLTKTIDEVIAWDDQTPNKFTEMKLWQICPFGSRRWAGTVQDAPDRACR